LDLMETLEVFFFLLQVPYLLRMKHVPKMNRSEFVDLKFFYNFYSLHFSVGRDSTIESFSEKEVQNFHEVQSWGL
jgi:hypothetical protein